MSRSSSVRERWRIAFVGGALASAIAIACGPGFLDGISGGTKPDETVTEDGGVDAAPACNSRLAPGPPGGQDDPSQNVELPLLAFESMRFDTFGSPDAGGPPPVGLDLDQKCTCPGRDSCRRPVNQDASCDGPRGEDNVLSGLFNGLNVGIPLFPQTFATDRIHDGRTGVLVEVRGWNGKKDDPKVTVTLRMSQWSEERRIPGTSGRERPSFDGTDVWTVDPDSVAAGDAGIGVDCRTDKDFKCLARTRDDNAYVVDGKLVARPRLDEAITPFAVRTSVGRIDFNFSDFTMIATLTGEGSAVRLQGEMTGKTAASNLIFNFANMQDFTKPEEPPICTTSLFALAKDSVCSARDLPAPGKGADSPCDYLSVAFSFAASPAIAGTIHREDRDPPPCGPQQYSCD